MSDFFMIMGYIFLFVLVGSLVCLLFIKVLCVLLRGPIANEVTIRAGARFKKTGMPRVVKALEEADEQKRVLSFPLVLLDSLTKSEVSGQTLERLDRIPSRPAGRRGGLKHIAIKSAIIRFNVGVVIFPVLWYYIGRGAVRRGRFDRQLEPSRDFPVCGSFFVDVQNLRLVDEVLRLCVLPVRAVHLNEVHTRDHVGLRTQGHNRQNRNPVVVLHIAKHRHAIVHSIGCHQNNRILDNIRELLDNLIAHRRMLLFNLDQLIRLDHDTFAVVSDAIECDFALRCQGDSMINARIFDGDVVFIRKQEFVDDGTIAAVLIDDEATLKRVYKLSDGRIELRAENPLYKSIMVGGEGETRTFRVLGKAVAFQSTRI